jgi:hypothetical protein
MGPLPAPALTRRRDGRKAENPRRAGSPERDHADLLDPRHPRTRADRGRRAASRAGGGPATKAKARARRENALEGRIPRRHRRARPQGRSQNELDAGYEALKPLASRRSSRSARTPRERQEGRGSERSTRRREEKALKGEAHGRSGALRRAGRDGGGGREGGPKPRTRHAGPGSGIPGPVSRVRRPGMCRRARKPRRGASSDVPVRPAGRCGGAATDLWRGAKAKGGPPSGKPVREHLPAEPGGRRNAERVGAQPMSARAGRPLSPRIAGRPQERAADPAARRGRGSHHAESL